MKVCAACHLVRHILRRSNGTVLALEDPPCGFDVVAVELEDGDVLSDVIVGEGEVADAHKQRPAFPFALAHHLCALTLPGGVLFLLRRGSLCTYPLPLLLCLLLLQLLALPLLRRDPRRLRRLRGAELRLRRHPLCLLLLEPQRLALLLRALLGRDSLGLRLCAGPLFLLRREPRRQFLALALRFGQPLLVCEALALGPLLILLGHQLTIPVQLG